MLSLEAATLDGEHRARRLKLICEVPVDDRQTLEIVDQEEGVVPLPGLSSTSRDLSSPFESWQSIARTADGWIPEEILDAESPAHVIERREQSHRQQRVPTEIEEMRISTEPG